jgi:ATP-dependent RNA helicase SUPV3L1/SUV3
VAEIATSPSSQGEAEVAAPSEAAPPAEAEAATTIEEAPASPPAEATAETAAVDGIAVAVAEVEAKEPAFEEIWRPRRHARGEHRKEGEPRKEGAPRGRRRSDAPQRDAQPQAEKAPPPTGANGHAERPAPREGRGYNARDKGKVDRDRGRNRDQGSQPTGERHPRRGKGFDKRHPDDRRKPEVHSAAPPRRVNMEADSPFAALGALRDALAKRGKESSST